MTFNRFQQIVLTSSFGGVYPQRMGQYLFNQLWEVRPDLALRLQGTENDPFHEDWRINACWGWLCDNWEGGV